MIKRKGSVLFSTAAFLFVLAIYCFKSREMTRKQRSLQSVTRDGKNLPPFSFDDLWSSDFSYTTFNPNWVSNTSYILRDEEGIKIVDLDKPDDQPRILVPNDFYEQTGGNGWSVSQDEEYFFIRTNYKKQWRHSYNASYAIYDVATKSLVWESGRSDIQYIKWSPVNHGVVWVVENNLFYLSDVTNSSTVITLEDTGGKNTIFNGIPDWVYEEEMVSSTNNIFWSPDIRFIAYLVTNDTDVERIEFTNYGDTQYPETVVVAYPKAGTMNPTVTLKVFDTATESTDNTFTVEAPTTLIGSEHLFCAVHWYPDGRAFQVHWLNRISNKAVPQICQYSTDWECSVADVAIEESPTGWIGNGGTTFRPLMRDDGTRSYFTIFSNNEGFWQIALITINEENTRTFLTTGTSVVTSLYAYDSVNDWLYFVAAHPEPKQRHLFRISVTAAVSSPVDTMTWECMTCGNFVAERCQWISPNFSPSRKYLVVNCGGPDVPMSTLQTVGEDGNYGMPEVVENNDDLIANKAGVKWPTKEYGSIESENGIPILYQLHKPMNFDPSKQYPLLIEVYGGPGYQKVQDRWTRGWAPIHMVSQYDIVVVSLDGRGSGYRGDDIAHMLYKKIGQLEKVDTTEVGRYFANMPWIDETRTAVWGWSYGGYTTTFAISEGSGVFKCGLAVAPLASRIYYDSIHSERYMTLPVNNPDGYAKCSILNSNLENFKNASYSIIHGMTDDNVHFQNAALISKALIAAEVDFDNSFYADEAHSINTGPNARKHIYKLLTRKIRTCFKLDGSQK